MTTVAPELWGQTDTSFLGHVTEIPWIPLSSESLNACVFLIHGIHTILKGGERDGLCMCVQMGQYAHM